MPPRLQICGVLGIWDVFGAVLAPAANMLLMLPCSAALYCHSKLGLPLAPPGVLCAAAVVHFAMLVMGMGVAAKDDESKVRAAARYRAYKKKTARVPRKLA